MLILPDLAKSRLACLLLDVLETASLMMLGSRPWKLSASAGPSGGNTDLRTSSAGLKQGRVHWDMR